MATQSILKSSTTLPTTSITTSTEPAHKNIFNIKVPSINSFINTSSGIVSGLIGFAGTLWDSKKLGKQVPEEDYERDPSASSSIVYEESPDVIILSRHKVHGRKERFSREYAINLKKLRAGRYSEHIPRKCMQLQIEEDVQPQIATLRESIVEQRKRTESCYPRMQNQKALHVEMLVPTLQSVESRDEIYVSKVNFMEKNTYLDASPDRDYEKIQRKISADANDALCDSERGLNSYDKHDESEYMIDKSQIGVKNDEMGFREKNYAKSDEASELENKLALELANQHIQKPMELLEMKSCIEEISEKDEVTMHNASCMEALHPEPQQILYTSSNISRSRSIDTIVVSIDGKIFRYFDKTQLCTIPALTFLEYLERLRTLEVTIEEAWYPTVLIHKLCCYKPKKLCLKDKSDLEKIIALSMIDFEYDNELHLILLLGTYTSVTGETDWPGNENEWLNMGFASTDMQKELQKGGVVGLLFTFYLSTIFPEFLKEMIDVSKYYSFDVFDVCKYFALDTVEILRAKELHRFFGENDRALDLIFLFYAGMIMHWFSIIVKNKDFNEVHGKVLKKARSTPREFMAKARSKLAQN